MLRDRVVSARYAGQGIYRSRAIDTWLRFAQPILKPTEIGHMPRRPPARRHSIVLCACLRDALCNRCRETLFGQLAGTAACRGQHWADRVAEHVPRDRAWPPHEGRAADIARRLASDLTRDSQLLELLAAELARWAAKRWGETTSDRVGNLTA